MSCIDHVTKVRVVVPGVKVEDIPVKGSTWGCVCERKDNSSMEEVCVAWCVGETKKQIFYSLPTDKEFLGCRVEDPSKAYTVFSERIGAGSNLTLSNRTRESHSGMRKIEAQAGVSSCEVGTAGGFQAESSENYSSKQSYQTNQTVIRIIVSGGNDGCFCCSDGTTLAIHVCTQKKDSEKSPALLHEPINEDDTTEPKDFQTAKHAKTPTPTPTHTHTPLRRCATADFTPVQKK